MTQQTLSSTEAASIQAQSVETPPTIQTDAALKNSITTNYYLQMAACFPPFMLPLLVVSLVMASSQKAKVKGTWLESHCQYQIATSKKGLGYFIVGVFTLLLIVGLPILLIGIISTLIRSLQGMQKLSEQKTI